MISCKVKGIILAVILSLASIMMPFSVNAETVSGDSPIIGVNIKYSDYDIDHEPYQLSASLEMPHRWQCVSSHSTMGCQAWISQDTSGTIQDEITGYINVSNGSYTDVLYEYEFVLDKSYVGYIDFSTPLSATTYSRYYVNGTSFTLTSKQLITSFTVTRYQLEYAPLEIIDTMKSWNVPVESYNALYYSLLSYDIYDAFNNNYFNYPMFRVDANKVIMRGHTAPTLQRDLICILYTDKNIFDLNTLTTYFNFSSSSQSANVTVSNVQQLSVAPDFNLIKFNISCDTNSYVYMVTKQQTTYIPIFINYSKTLVSTDFALLFGLSNPLLDNLDIIANGTNTSNSAASDLNDASNDYSSIADDVVGVEEGLTSNFETEVNKIDLNTGLNVFGGHFLTSATWVRTQFDRLTENTPYGSMVVYGLTLGFVLLMLGKVFL